MNEYKHEFDIEIEKLNELEELCKKFDLNPLKTPKDLQIYQNKDLLVQNKFEENKVKILITSDKTKLYNSFMEKFSKIYSICEN